MQDNQNAANINDDDMRAFRDIKKDLGEATFSNVNLDDNEVDLGNQNEPQEYNKQFNNMNSPNLGEDDEAEFGQRESDNLLMAELSEETQQLEFLKKLGLNLDDARPSGAQILKALKYFDLAVKFEVVLHDLHYILFVTSNIELWLFLFGVIFSLKVPGMGVVWMFLPHVIRGVIGIRIWLKLPKSHEIVKALAFDQEYDPDDDNTEFQDGDSRLGFDAVHQRIKINIEKLFYDHYQKFQLLMKIYMGLTVFSYILDFFASIILIRKYGEPGQWYSEMTLMAFMMIFMGTNIYWIGQIILFKYKFPQYISSYLMSAFLTAGQKMQDKMRYWNNKAHDKMGRTAKRLTERAKSAANKRRQRPDAESQPQAAEQ